MRAASFETHGGPEVLRVGSVPDPVPGPGEVLVRLRATCLNHLDLWVRQGLPGVKIPLPFIPGNEGSGTVESLGPGVTGLAPGDEVIVTSGCGCGRCRECLAGRESFCPRYVMLGYMRNGCDAELVTAPAGHVLPKPPSLSWEEAAAFPLVSLTAWHMLHGRGGLRPGETVLVMAAGSGIGHVAIQLARVSGARVIAAAGSDSKLEKAKALGADAVVNYSAPEWWKKVSEAAGGAGVDLVFEHTGQELFEGALRTLARGGRIVTCGATSGPRISLDLRFLYSRQLEVTGSFMGSRAELLEALRLREQGRIRVLVDRVFPLEEIRAAHERLHSRDVFGKIVLAIPG